MDIDELLEKIKKGEMTPEMKEIITALFAREYRETRNNMINDYLFSGRKEDTKK